MSLNYDLGVLVSNDKIFIITSGVEAGTIETMPFGPGMELIRNEELAGMDINFSLDQKVCITSEYSLASVLGKLDPSRRMAVEVLKDKTKFRELLWEIYPYYSYRSVKAADIKHLKIDKKSVIKPARGIFGTAVRTIGPETDVQKLSEELMAEIGKNMKVYPDSVLSGEDFIIEDFIEGEEYAVDMFYDARGNPCIVNIMHHPAPQNTAYLHMMYNSSKDAFDKMYAKSKMFFKELNRLLKVKNFAMHSELRLWNGKVCPIEINAMRFGGMGLCNLVYYSFGINPFLCFLNDVEPDWESVWKGKEDKVYSFFIAYNGAGIKADEFRPMPEKLKRCFTRVLREQLFDHRRQLAFGIYFLEETEGNVGKLLRIEFDDFFEDVTRDT